VLWWWLECKRQVFCLCELSFEVTNSNSHSHFSQLLPRAKTGKGQGLVGGLVTGQGLSMALMPRCLDCLQVGREERMRDVRIGLCKVTFVCLKVWEVRSGVVVCVSQRREGQLCSMCS
jgi:hypothetical protein